MKKIFAILSVVAMVFTSCENGGDRQPNKPNFPELQQITAEAGGSYELTFAAEKAWKISLTAASQSYAYLTYEGFIETTHTGAMGEHTIMVNVKEDAVSYAKDIVISVEMTMENFTETIATYTIARTEFPVNVKGAPNAGMEDSVKSVFSDGGHPADGPFVKTPHTYTLRHYTGSDAKYAEFYVEHDLEPSSYNYAVYVKDESGEFVKVNTSEEADKSWVEFVSFGKKKEKFRLYMDYSKGIITKNVGYEAYVNLEDAYGDALVSVYHIYNPDEEIVEKTSFSLADADLAAEKGITMKGAGLNYTLTYPSAEVFAADYAAAAFKFEGYSEVYGGFGSGTDALVFEYDATAGVYYVRLADDATVASLTRTEVLNISAVGRGMDSYVVNLVFDWIEDTSAEIPDEYSANFANTDEAAALGATLQQLDSASDGYDAEWGVDLQYHLTYTSRTLFDTPTLVALDIPGFEYGTVSNIHHKTRTDLEFSYSDALELVKDSTTGQALLVLKEGVKSSSIPNGVCDLICSNANGTTFMRILFELNAAPIARCEVSFNVEIDPFWNGALNVPVITSATRAYGDATTATRLQYAVYDAEGNIVAGCLKTNATINMRTEVKCSLIAGERYSAIFWASAPDAPYTVDLESKSMSVDYANALCNDENRDAFYAKYEFSVSEGGSFMVQLRRPFAQINVGVSESKSGVDNITKSMIKVAAYSKFDFVREEASEPVDVEFGYAPVPAEQYLPVPGYRYVAMAYVLANSESSLCDLIYGYTDGTTSVANTVFNVQLNRNYQISIISE